MPHGGTRTRTAALVVMVRNRKGPRVAHRDARNRRGRQSGRAFGVKQAAGTRGGDGPHERTAAPPALFSETRPERWGRGETTVEKQGQQSTNRRGVQVGTEALADLKSLQVREILKTQRLRVSQR